MTMDPGQVAAAFALLFVGIIFAIKGLIAIRNKFSQPKPHQTLHFKSAESALEYAVKFMNCEHIEDSTLPCIVDSVSYLPDVGLIGNVRLPSQSGCVERVAAIVDRGASDSLIGKFCGAVVGPRIQIGDIGNCFLVTCELEQTLSDKGWKISRYL